MVVVLAMGNQCWGIPCYASQVGPPLQGLTISVQGLTMSPGMDNFEVRDSSCLLTVILSPQFSGALVADCWKSSFKSLMTLLATMCH